MTNLLILKKGIQALNDAKKSSLTSRFIALVEGCGRNQINGYTEGNLLDLLVTTVFTSFKYFLLIL